MKSNWLVVLLLLGICSTTCLADDSALSQFPDYRRVGDSKLILNGSGFKRVTFFRIKVYAIALYLEAPSVDAQVIMGSSQVKKLVLNFFRSVSKKTLYSAIEESLQDNFADWRKLYVELGQLRQVMPDVARGDSIEFVLLPDAVHIRHNQVNEVQIKSRHFQQALLSIWLGPDPVSDSLKQALLGQ